MTQAELDEAIRNLPTRLPPAATDLFFQPGFTPVPGKPGVFTVQAPPFNLGAWLERNQTTLIVVGAGITAFFMMRRGRRG